MRKKIALLLVIAGVGGAFLLSFLSLEEVKKKEGRTPLQARTISSIKESLHQKLRRKRIILKNGEVSYKRMILTPAELSLFIEENYGDQIPPEIRWWKLNAKGNLVILSGEGSLAKAKKDLSPALRKALPDELMFEVRFYLVGENGIGKIKIKSFSLAGLPLPVSLALRILSSISPEDRKRLEQGFLLPPGFRKIRVEKGLFIINP